MNQHPLQGWLMTPGQFSYAIAEIGQQLNQALFAEKPVTTNYEYNLGVAGRLLCWFGRLISAGRDWFGAAALSVKVSASARYIEPVGFDRNCQLMSDIGQLWLAQCRLLWPVDRSLLGSFKAVVSMYLTS
ncbi:hypothetical protein QQ045_002778 [Rhodiola kirilowii]